MTLSALMRDGRRPLRLIRVFLPWLLFDVRRPRTFCGSAFEPRSFDLGSSGSNPRALLGSDRGRSCFTRHPVLGFHNRRGRANDTCLDGSSVVLNELANGYVRVKSGSIIH